VSAEVAEATGQTGIHAPDGATVTDVENSCTAVAKLAELDWVPGPKRPATPVEAGSGSQHRLGAERKYRISEAEQALLTTVGAFRAVAVNDLLAYPYASQSSAIWSRPPQPQRSRLIRTASADGRR